jgi:signal transduction histidine kinase
MLDTQKGYLTIDVKDTGIGIEEEKISKLFKPFTCASEEHH